MTYLQLQTLWHEVCEDAIPEEIKVGSVALLYISVHDTDPRTTIEGYTTSTYAAASIRAVSTATAGLHASQYCNQLIRAYRPKLNGVALTHKSELFPNQIHFVFPDREIKRITLPEDWLRE